MEATLQGCLVSAPISLGVNSLHSPGRIRPSVSGPIRTRTSDRTGWPTAAHILRTWRFRPSRSVMVRCVVPPPALTVWPRVTSAYKGYEGYQQRTSREIPLVILEP